MNKISFNREQLINIDFYREAIMNSYRFNIEFNNHYCKFQLRKRMKETAISGEIRTLKEFQEQLILFIRELS